MMLINLIDPLTVPAVVRRRASARYRYRHNPELQNAMKRRAREAYERDPRKAIDRVKQHRIENPGSRSDEARNRLSRQRELYAADPMRWRGYNLKKYGIAHEDYEKLLRQQRSRCAICQTDTPGTSNGKQKFFSVDHDHITGSVRGLLCNGCNRGLGLIDDSREWLLKALAYLERQR